MSDENNHYTQLKLDDIKYKNIYFYISRKIQRKLNPTLHLLKINSIRLLLPLIFRLILKIINPHLHVYKFHMHIINQTSHITYLKLNSL